MGTLRRHPSKEPSTSHPLNIHLSLGVPTKGAQSMFPNRVPKDSDNPSQDPLVYSFILVCLQDSPKRSPPTYWEKYIRSLSAEPYVDGRPTYRGVQPSSTRGSLTTLLFLPQGHAALDTIPSTLAWVHHSPISQGMSQHSHSGYTLHNCYRLPRDQG